MIDKPVTASLHKVAAVGAFPLAALTWYDTLDLTIRILAGLLAIAASLYSIYTTHKQRKSAGK
jgi:hypothetical protein